MKLRSTSAALAFLNALAIVFGCSDGSVPHAEPHMTAQNLGAVGDVEAEPASHPAPNPEERYARHRAAIEAHRSTPIDKAWASEMTASFDTALAAQKSAVKLQGSPSTIDCRQSSCAISLRWASYAKALEEYPGFLSVGLQLRMACRISIALPPPEVLDGEYEATLLATCAR
jgi:hypothetical protein